MVAITLIEGLQRRSRSLYQKDGLWDIYIGLVLLLAIAPFQFVHVNHEARITVIQASNSDSGKMTLKEHIVARTQKRIETERADAGEMRGYTLTSCAGFLLICLQFAIEPIRCRFIYGRLGYAKPKEQFFLMFWLVCGFCLFVPLKLVAVMASGPERPDSPIWQLLHVICGSENAIASAFVATGFAIWYWRFRYKRHLTIAVICALSCVGLATMNLEHGAGALCLSLILGASMLAAGCGALAEVLRSPMLPDGDSN